MDDQYNFDFSSLMKMIVFSLFVTATIYLASRFFTKSTIVFCDVGQGDAAYIRTKSGLDIVVDFGQGKKILECLGRYMPFYDNEIDVALISHFDKDHYEGITYLNPRYKIKKLIYPRCEDKNCLSTLKSNTKNTTFQRISYARISSIKSTDFLITPLKIPDNGFVKGSNDDSEVFYLKIDKISILFTGDANLDIEYGLLDGSDINVDVLKVPHHGSRYNLNSTFLELADPQVSVISVGNNNSYGHPHREVISLLKALNKKYVRTDTDGDILIELLQEGFVVKSQKSQKQYKYKYMENEKGK